MDARKPYSRERVLHQLRGLEDEVLALQSLMYEDLEQALLWFWRSPLREDPCFWAAWSSENLDWPVKGS
jgi:hypothetical protein